MQSQTFKICLASKISAFKNLTAFVSKHICDILIFYIMYVYFVRFSFGFKTDFQHQTMYAPGLLLLSMKLINIPVCSPPNYSNIFPNKCLNKFYFSITATAYVTLTIDVINVCSISNIMLHN